MQRTEIKVKDSTRKHVKKQTTELSLLRREMEINAVVRKRGSGKINEGWEEDWEEGEQVKDEKTKKRDRAATFLAAGHDADLSAR